MTCNVFGGTLNYTQSIDYLSLQSQLRLLKSCVLINSIIIGVNIENNREICCVEG